MEAIRSAWVAHQEELAQALRREAEEKAQRESELFDSVKLTIGGATHPLWWWREGAECAHAPTPEELDMLRANGLGASEQSDGTWYVIDPRYVEYGE